TGDYIDSLTVKGQIFDALEKQPDDFVSVVLYEVDSTFTDSIIYKEAPKYVTNTLDSLTTFTIENIKAGQYMLLALKDGNQDYKFQQKIDKIGFHKSFINVPTDSIYNIKLFKEDLDFNATRPSLVAGEKIAFGYEGDYKGMKINILSDTPEDFDYTITKDEKADTLYYWYKPKLEVDSLIFNVTKGNVTKDFTLKIRSKEQDTLKVNAVTIGNLNYGETYKISASTPIETIDETKISIIDKDSVTVDFKTAFDTISNIVALDFEKTENNSYKIKLLPNSLTDFYGIANDTLDYSIKTKAFSDYGNVRVSLQNAKYPIIVQLSDEKGEVKAEQFSDEPKFFDFRYVNPGKYLLRVIFDSNGNKKYDTGSYLKKQQPERVSYYPELIDVRANWDEIREFILLD
ncbi:MAG: hypothetical protein P8X62_01355, partial [Flavobacteriaceae bacterium]